MSTRFAATLIATTLALGGTAVLAAPAPAASELSATSIENAVSAGTLAETLTQSMGTEPTAEQLTQLLSALESLRENSPSAAAKAASALVDVAWDNAPDNPQTAMAQLDIAHAILCHPAVAAAEPEIVENALAQLQGATRLAERSAATTGTELTGTDIAPDVGTCAAEAPEDLIAEAIELADAQADLAGFTTAAGGPPATNSAAGAVGAAPTPSFVSFSSPPGGGGGGGAVDPPTPVASPAG